MENMNMDDFKRFLEMSADERLEQYLGIVGLKWWEKLSIRHLNKWWTYMRNANPHLDSHILWESIYKGIF